MSEGGDPVKQCPNCRLVNPDNAQACDCGFDFAFSVQQVAVESKLGEFVSNALSGKPYGISTSKNPLFGAWETAVLERPGFVNWLLGRRRLVWRIILVTYEVIGARIGAELMSGLMKRQPIAWVVVQSSPSDGDIKALHLLARCVIKSHPEEKWKDLFFERIKSDLAHLNPDVIAETQPDIVQDERAKAPEENVEGPLKSLQPPNRARVEQIPLGLRKANTSPSDESTSMTRIILQEVRAGDNYERLTACIEESGDLLLEGQDIGPAVEKFWGDTDYEYWLRVKKEHKDAVLLHLLRDRFNSESAFRAWLEKRRIPCEFHNWV